MRDAYYQSVGNPLQLDRLPATRPGIELLPRPSGEPWTALVGCLFVATGAVIGVLLFYHAPGIGWLEPFDWIFAGPPIVVCVALWLLSGQARWLFHPALLAGVALLALTRTMSGQIETAVVALAIGIWTYAFGRHATLMVSAAPVARDEATVLRAAWQGQLLVSSAAVTALVWLTLATGSLAWQCACLALPAVALCLPAPAGLTTAPVRLIRDALLAWCSYQAPPIPGLLQSPLGTPGQRSGLVIVVALLTAVALVRWTDSPLARVLAMGRASHVQLTQALDARDAGLGERIRYGTLTWLVTTAAAVLLPVLVPAVLVIAVTFPVLCEAAAARDRAGNSVGGAATGGAAAGQPSASQTLWADLRRSADPTERQSLCLGHVVADGSPVLVPRSVYGEHAHGLGDSGVGKTALFLCPTIEQLVSVGDCSIVVLDLKADSLELLASLEAASESVRRDRGLVMPVKHFSNQADKATFVFNPMTQTFWENFDLLTRTDILCGANGLTYGTDYGQGYYSSANAAILYYALKTFPHVTTFGELADAIGTVLTTAKKRELHPEIRKAGVHVHEVMKRLAACAAMNVAGHTGHAPDVVDQAIDLQDVFVRPQLVYFHLSTTLSPSGAPEIARLVNYLLLAAATQSARRHPVYLVIDEFQRMVASNLEYMLQLARSMGVGVILANQSLEDLKRSTTNLIPAVEANCRLRQWFSVSSLDDQERLIRASGLTVDRAATWSETTNADGRKSTTFGQQEQVVSRFTSNDIALVNDHPLRSILRISRGAGYAQYGGLPVIIESNFHISEDEYRRRRALPWPEPLGTFVPQHRGGINVPASPPGPVWTEEVLDLPPRKPLSSAEQAAVKNLFDELRQRMDDERPHGKGRRP